MPMLALVADPPEIDDPIMRAALVDWFDAHAQQWRLHADGLLAYGATDAADSARARAAVCEQFAHELEQKHG